MKKVLFVFVLTGLILTGCSSSSTQDKSKKDAVEVPDSVEDLKGDLPQDTARDIKKDVVDIDSRAGDVAEDISEDMGVEETTKDMAQDEYIAPEIEEVQAPPEQLPFNFERENKGEPVTQQEIDDFTRKAASFFSKINYFRWVIWTSHGMDASTGKPDYLVWWQDVVAVKKGDLVTFRHSNLGGAHNIMIPTSRVLWSAIGDYMLTRDKYAGRVVEQYCKGITATMKGMMWDKNDPNKYIMARNIVTQNYQITLDGGRKKAVDYTPWYNTYKKWNAWRIHYPHNPYWGDIYVTNIRSKDDVPHIFRATGYLVYLLKETDDEKIKQACSETLDYIRGFAKDIVDHNYHIRSKDEQGKPFIPKGDLASFVDFIALDKKTECTNRVVTALIAYDDDRGQEKDCGTGFGSKYDQLATQFHYFNYAIIVNFHISAVVWALVKGHYKTAYLLLEGLAQRFDSYMHPDKNEAGPKNKNWPSDLSAYLLSGAAAGLPLTNEEVHLIHKWYSKAFDEAMAWDRWDLWASNVPDGTYDPNTGYRPKLSVKVDKLGFVLGYCASPFKNPNGVAPVNCELLKQLLLTDK